MSNKVIALRQLDKSETAPVIRIVVPPSTKEQVIELRLVKLSQSVARFVCSADPAIAIHRPEEYDPAAWRVTSAGSPEEGVVVEVKVFLSGSETILPAKRNGKTWFSNLGLPLKVVPTHWRPLH